MIRVKKGSPPPPPEESEKPEDVTQYAFAPVCDLDHVTGYGKTEISIKDLEILTACSHCERPARFQTILKTAEPMWLQHYTYDRFRVTPEDDFDIYCWTLRGYNPRSEYWWTKAERVRSITL